MKNLLNYLWYLMFVRRGDLVAGTTVPIVMAETVLEESIDVVGLYIDVCSIPSLCYVRSADGDSHTVYVHSLKKVSKSKNPELFI